MATFYPVIFLSRWTQPPLWPLMALALRVSSKITPLLPALQFPGAPRCRGGGQLWPCPIGVPTWASAPGLSLGTQEGGSVGALEPVLRAGKAHGWHLAPSAIPSVVWPGRKSGCWPARPNEGEGRGEGFGEGRPLPFFSAVPAEHNCHLQDFNGQPAAYSSGGGLKPPCPQQVGPWEELGGAQRWGGAAGGRAGWGGS